MAEMVTVVGAAAAVAQLFDFAQKTRECLSDMVHGYQVLQDLTGQVTHMETIISRLQCHELSAQSLTTSTRCLEKLSQLSNILGKLQISLNGGMKSKIYMLTVWARKKRKIVRLMDSIFDVEFSLLKMDLLIKVCPRKAFKSGL
jgi:hypothetical protein